jgi:hypothetical protein
MNADVSLLGRVFDQYQNMMQVAQAVREASRQRGVARPHLLELSRRETGLADFLPDLRVTRYPTHAENQPTLTDPVVIPFPDKSFDACLVTDAYEHIPPTQRRSLLSEMVRVTKGVVLLACPMDSEVVSRFDKVVFDFIWGKYAERFEPLDQHVEYGLEPLDQVLSSLVAQGADRAIALPDNYVYRWIHQILLYFDLQHRQPHRDLYEPLNRIYNERIAPFDYREPCYRYLIVAGTDPRLDFDAFEQAMKGRQEVPETVAEAEGALLDAFAVIQDRSGDRLRELSAEQARLRADLSERDSRLLHAALEIDRLRGEIEARDRQMQTIQATRAWRIVESYWNVAERVLGSRRGSA